MQASQLPSKIPLPFANSGTKNSIPTASQIGITAGAASLTDGFPPLTMTPLSAGGVPPSGADFNGILNLITAIQQWQSAGGSFKFDATFAASIGGYPKGAVLMKATNDGFWLNTVDANSANPDTGGANWLDLVASAFAYSKGTTGWVKLPGGIIVQWFRNITTTANSAGQATFSLTFPTAFTSSVYGSAFYPVQEASSIAAGQAVIGALAPGLNSMSLNLSGGPANSLVAISGIVIGV